MITNLASFWKLRDLPVLSAIHPLCRRLEYCLPHRGEQGEKAEDPFRLELYSAEKRSEARVFSKSLKVGIDRQEGNGLVSGQDGPFQRPESPVVLADCGGNCGCAECRPASLFFQRSQDRPGRRGIPPAGQAASE